MLDFSPAALPVSRQLRIVRHAAMELRMLLRNGEQLVLALVIPLAALIAGTLWHERLGLQAADVPPSVLALATWSTAFTSLAIATGFERRYGVLERLVATPLTKVDLIAGKMLAMAALVAGQGAIIAIVAAALGWRSTQGLADAGRAVLTLVVAIAVFAGLGLILAGTLKAELTLALANLIYLLGAGVSFGVEALPEPVRTLASLLPTALLGESLRAGTGWTATFAGVILLLWAIPVTLIARKAFRWTS